MAVVELTFEFAPLGGAAVAADVEEVDDVTSMTEVEEEEPVVDDEEGVLPPPCGWKGGEYFLICLEVEIIWETQRDWHGFSCTYINWHKTFS